MSFLKNRTVVGVICILLSLLICFGLTPLFNQSVSQKAEIVRVSIEVCYIINTRPYDPYGYAKPDINTQPLFYSLRDNEIYLDIGNEEKINNTFEIVCQWMDKILIPKMNELCATE